MLLSEAGTPSMKHDDRRFFGRRMADFLDGLEVSALVAIAALAALLPDTPGMLLAGYGSAQINHCGKWPCP
jgi:hypothetical protein